jgi:methionyl-tRNA formyltransferase
MKIIYAGCNFFASVLDEILSNPDCELLYCLTDNDSNETKTIVKLCKLHDIPLHFGAWSEDLVETINTFGADLFISAAYPYLVPVEKINCKHCINIHPSLLPMGRGPNPLPNLVTQSPQFAGITIHTMTSKFDEGAIILQTPITIGANTNFDTLSMAMFIAAPKLIDEFLNTYPELISTAYTQQNGKYWPCCPPEQRTINWGMGVDEVLHMHKKYGFTGVIFPFQNGLQIEATNIIGIHGSHNYPAGEVVMDGGKFIYVAVWDGIVRIWL